MDDSGGVMMRGGAIIDATGTYRYRLWRDWHPTGPRVLFVMLNPSTADARADDATIRRCIGFARRWGYGCLEVVNLFAYRAPHPAALRCVHDPIGPQNDRHICAAAGRADRVIAAWGNRGRLFGRDEVVTGLIGTRTDLSCLGTTHSGQPRHPLYVTADAVVLPFAARGMRSWACDRFGDRIGVHSMQGDSHERG